MFIIEKDSGIILSKIKIIGKVKLHKWANRMAIKVSKQAKRLLCWMIERIAGCIVDWLTVSVSGERKRLL